MKALLTEADRQLTICNACRYCEGYCAVWPAMELRRTFKDSDILYLANLCFDCRACYYACQFAPPHQFAVNIPEIFSQIRTETYQDYSWPRLLARMVKSNTQAAVAITIACVVAVFAFVLLAQGPGVLFGVHVGDGAFFRVVPYVAMVVPPSIISLFALGVFATGAFRFWRDTRGLTRGDVLLGRVREGERRRLRDALHEGRRLGLQLPGRAVQPHPARLPPFHVLRLPAGPGLDHRRGDLPPRLPLGVAVRPDQPAGRARHRSAGSR